MDDFDVEDFNTKGNFVQKDELKEHGPRRVKIQDVEQRDGFKDDNGESKPELVLVFSDETRFGLRAWCNRDVLKTAFGRRTSKWVGKVIELYVDPTVTKPGGARVGGIRIRIPAAGTRPAPHDEFTSDLEEEGPVRPVF